MAALRVTFFSPVTKCDPQIVSPPRQPTKAVLGPTFSSRLRGVGHACYHRRRPGLLPLPCQRTLAHTCRRILPPTRDAVLTSRRPALQRTIAFLVSAARLYRERCIRRVAVSPVSSGSSWLSLRAAPSKKPQDRYFSLMFFLYLPDKEIRDRRSYGQTRMCFAGL